MSDVCITCGSAEAAYGGSTHTGPRQCFDCWVDPRAAPPALLEPEKCPVCDGRGYTARQVGPNDWEQEQCEACWRREQHLDEVWERNRESGARQDVMEMVAEKRDYGDFWRAWYDLDGRWIMECSRGRYVLFEADYDEFCRRIDNPYKLGAF